MKLDENAKLYTNRAKLDKLRKNSINCKTLEMWDKYREIKQGVSKNSEIM